MNNTGFISSVIVSENVLTLCGCNWTRIHNHLVHKRTLNHLAKLTK